MMVWFAVIALLGVGGIMRAPTVLGAINPAHALEFFSQNGLAGFLVLGAVVLVVTGCEALYADMGHFGRRPIRLTWYTLVLPALLLNYFGQGALLLADPGAAHNPFYRLAPSWALYPLVALATAATVIASQAVISGAFSLTRQAVQLRYSPRLEIEPHVRGRDRADLRSPGQLGAHGRDHRPGPRLRLVVAARRRLRHRGHGDHGDDVGALLFHWPRSGGSGGPRWSSGSVPCSSASTSRSSGRAR